jgi:small subunit ribosomal protein S21
LWQNTVDGWAVAGSVDRFSIHSKDMSVEVNIRKGEPIERALRRLKKRLDREGVIRDVRAKRYFEKPCEVRRRKKKVAAFSAMLRARYENQ